VSSLKTGGFGELIREIAVAARGAPDAAAAVRTALTAGGRVGEEIGLLAVTAADRLVVDLLRGSRVGLAGGAEGADRLYLTRTGRLAVRLAGAPAPPDAHPLGALDWADDDAEAVAARWRAEQSDQAKLLAATHRELAAEPEEDVHRRIAQLQYAIVHMAPVLIYVGERVYNNLGKLSTLPGKSMPVGSEQSVLNRLRQRPVRTWAAQDACFVGCLSVLLDSGPPVRAEEFNGAQLNPETLGRFLLERIAEYGGEPPHGPAPTGLPELAAAAAECRRLRARTLGAGTLAYREISGLTLHKREHLMAAPTSLTDLPGGLADHTARLFGVGTGPDTRIDDLAPAAASLAGRLASGPALAGFGTGFEAALHGFVAATAEAFEADVAMSRGPKTFDPLRVEPTRGPGPLTLRTGDFYCCVAPRRAFVERFEDRAELVRALAAYSARMRFNTWHYLPHTLGIVEREPGREDWFFAPTMPDVASWSDQHHTGHVAFGVRYAIRVPFGIGVDDRQLPGLYDLRLMRIAAPPFTIADLRGAIAAAGVLRHVYQAMSAYEPVIGDFDKHWYGRFHG
jgi:hypothetical protein